MSDGTSPGLRHRVRILNSLRIVFSILAVGLILFGLFRMRDTSRARGWARGTARVVRSDVAEFVGKGGRTYWPKVVFSYAVGSARFMSNRIAFRPLASPRRQDAARIAARYPVGGAVQILYDPTDPEQAVLELGINPWVPILAGGALSMLAVGVRMLRGRAERQQARSR